MVAPVPAQISSAPCNVRTPSTLNSFRILPVATGVGTFSPLVFQASSLPYPASSPNSRWLILLRTLCRRQKPQPLSNQANPNSLHKIPGVGVSLRHLCALCVSALSFVSRLQVPPSQRLAASLRSLFPVFCPRFLCFQSLAASFPKTPGVGVPPNTSAPSFASPIICATQRLYPLWLHTIAHTSRHHGGVPLLLPVLACLCPRRRRT